MIHLSKITEIRPPTLLNSNHRQHPIQRTSNGLSSWTYVLNSTIRITFQAFASHQFKLINFNKTWVFTRFSFSQNHMSLSCLRCSEI